MIIKDEMARRFSTVFSGLQSESPAMYESVLSEAGAAASPMELGLATAQQCFEGMNVDSRAHVGFNTFNQWFSSMNPDQQHVFGNLIDRYDRSGRATAYIICLLQWPHENIVTPLFYVLFFI
jgi:hypothetical protein